jgi:hypothetical protein
METLRELVQIRYQQKNWRLWRERTPELTQALRVLSRDSAHLLAGELWARYDHEDIAYFLGQLNTSVPGALADWTAEVLAQGQLLPSWLYLGAPASTTRRLLDLVDHPAFTKQHNGLLFALAWIGDDLVRDQFRAWRENPPPWRSHLYVAPPEYAHEAGWELTLEGSRRGLYHQTCYELVPADESELTPSMHAVEVFAPTQTACGWCGRELVTLLDIDLRDPHCAFLTDDVATANVVAMRLRIAYCLWCSYYATLYTDVDLQGSVRWSAANEPMPHILERVGLGSDDELPPPEPRRLALGHKRRTPFEAVGRFMLDESGISQIGGHPEWIQTATFPVCPSCRSRMMYVGQVCWEELDELDEGSTYAFVCLPCGKGATIYQQT